jgi:hypothetical protein
MTTTGDNGIGEISDGTGARLLRPKTNLTVTMSENIRLTLEI